MKTSYTLPCTAVEIRKPKQGARTSIVLLLILPNGDIAIAWFNAQPVQGKKSKTQCRVKKQSKFTKLYRLTTGKEPARTNEGRRLMNHLVGKWFVFNVDGTTAATGELLAQDVKPRYPIITDAWTNTGELKPKTDLNLGCKDVSDDVKSDVTDDVKTTYKRRKPTSEKPHSYSGSPAISTTNNQQLKHQDTYTPVVSVASSTEFSYTPSETLTEVEADLVSIPTPSATFNSMERQAQTYFEQRDDYETGWEQVSKTECVFHYHQKPQEIDDDYIDRVLNESMANW